ncbi:hypothetical protein Cgig2_033483 [Carnegiea gigantea]|uniref:RNase H type-1 domain-containing protein n=1 Tax=Carnegiea gigantea TaxID=171969 RepID=A0A9Q1GPD3_9CARY|nr:hypothetical protein Cgig2_033483 [Carnegiea gigantea]
MGVCPSIRAELRAVLHNLLVAKDNDFKKLEVKVDSMLVVGMLKGSLRCNARHYAIIHRCKGLLESPNWEVTVSHCYREANQVADTLVNLASSLIVNLSGLMNLRGSHRPPLASSDSTTADDAAAEPDRTPPPTEPDQSVVGSPQGGSTQSTQQ